MKRFLDRIRIMSVIAENTKELDTKELCVKNAELKSLGQLSDEKEWGI